MPYEIEFSPEAIDHIKQLPAVDRAVVFDNIELQLPHQPEVETRNRKPMRENPLAMWELRIGDLRVFFNVHRDDNKVRIVAVGRKDGSRFMIGGEVVHL